MRITCVLQAIVLTMFAATRSHATWLHACGEDDTARARAPAKVKVFIQMIKTAAVSTKQTPEFTVRPVSDACSRCQYSEGCVAACLPCALVHSLEELGRPWRFSKRR